MSRLAIYLDFSYKYKKLVQNKLNNDIKFIIWKIYLKLFMTEKIKKFISKNIYRCRDCNRADWALFNGVNQNFYCVGACNLSNIYFTDMPCCIKYICLKNKCRIKSNCSMCKKDNYIQLNSDISDIGHNPIEGKQILNFYCFNCNNLNYHKLTWNEMCNNDSVLGKFV